MTDTQALTTAEKMALIQSKHAEKFKGKQDENIATIGSEAEGEHEKIGVQMSFWPEHIAAMPTELARASLFGLPSDKSGARKILRNTKLDSRSDVEVLYTGEELGAKEETTWLACLRIARGEKLGERIFINLTDLLKELELSNTGGKRGNRQAVMTRLDRLSAAHFKIQFARGGKTYKVTSGMLKWGIENETGDMYVRLDPDGAALFENLSYQPWKVRLSLTTDAAARILTYVSSQERGKLHSVKLDDLRKWVGYGGRIRQFRTVCTLALLELEEKRVIVKGSSKVSESMRGLVATWIREKDLKALEVD